MKDEMDLALEALLKAPERPTDERFVVQMRQAVLVEKRLAAARRAAWRRFGLEMAAAAAAIAAFWLLARLAPPDSEGLVPLFGPAAAGLLLLALWVLVSVKPSGRAIFAP